MPALIKNRAEILAYAKKHSIKAAAKQYNVSTSSIAKWRKDVAVIPPKTNKLKVENEILSTRIKMLEGVLSSRLDELGSYEDTNVLLCRELNEVKQWNTFLSKTINTINELQEKQHD